MAGRPGGRNPLPYELLAGVVPITRGWLVASAKLQGIQIYPNEPEVMATLVDVIDYRPSFKAIALDAPIGLLDEVIDGGRACDREARKILGWPRGGAILTPPIRRALKATSYREAAAICNGISPVVWGRIKHIREVEQELAPYRQRTIFEIHPEMSFYQLNDDKPMRYAKRTVEGIRERRELLQGKIPGIERLIDVEMDRVKPWQLLDAASCLWTARRVVARAMSRLPEDPEWDSQGVRMEIMF